MRRWCACRNKIAFMTNIIGRPTLARFAPLAWTLIWIAAIVYCIFDVRHSPAWMVEDHVFRFALWPVLFLTLAGWAEELKKRVR